MPTIFIREDVLDKLMKHMGNNWTNTNDAIKSILDEIEEYEDCDGGDCGQLEPVIDWSELG